MKGRWIVVLSWVTLGLFAATIIPNAAGLDALDAIADIVALSLFLAALVIWTYAFGVAVVRSARGDDIGVGSLFFLQGSAPRDVRRHLFVVLGISVVLGFTTALANPFAALEPMFPLALMGLWSARYGTFPARTDMQRASSSSAPKTRPQPGGAR
jgi:hypothetical protein